jgi:CDP-diacylglycerol--glycerol-3-phosphate 3-phosphatidyltransferase
LLTASGVCDALDGAVARATGRSTRFGALLDSTIDRVADALPLAAMMVYFADRPLQTLVPAAAMIGAFVVPYVRARAEALGVLLPPLFMRRPERMVLVVLSLLLGTLPLAGRLPEALMLGGVGILALLSFAGAASALRAASNELDPEASRDSESIGQNLPSEPVTASGP